MVVKTQKEQIIKDSEETVYQFKRKAGRHIVNRRPIFSPDRKSLLVPVENVVRVYNVQTGDLVRILETEKPCHEIIAVEFPKNEIYNVCACSRNGCITTWTYERGVTLREVDLELGPNEQVFSFDLIDSNEAFVAHGKTKDENLTFTSFNIKTGKVVLKYQGYPVMNAAPLIVSLGICDGESYAAICNGSRYLYILNLVQPHLKLRYFTANSLRFVSVAAHPKNSELAVTDTLGRVTILRGYLYEKNNLAKEILHWHYLPVFASTYSKEGSYLYTGGMEKVLLKWSIGGFANKAQEKQFIVRMPGYIRHITANDTHIALSLNNNSIVIALAQMKVTTTIQECGGLSPAARALGCSLVYHRQTDCLLLGGRTGYLQMYSTASDKLLYNLDITESNGIPPTRLNLIPVEAEIACAAVSGDGAWLVTSEYRNDNVVYSEERLKFWNLQQNGPSPFTLNTCVNLSHGGCQVVSLALSSKGDFCVSAGNDNKFRIWKLETIKDGKREYAWSCLTTCYYSSGFAHSTAQEILNSFKNNEFSKKQTESPAYLTEDYRNNDVIMDILNIHKGARYVDMHKEKFGGKSTDMGAVAISADGSLIAAWFGSKLTVWDTHQCNLKTSLAHPLLRPKGLHVQFGNHDAAHYLVCTTENCLAVWSLLSLTIKWYVNLRPACLSADPFTNKIAVVTQENHVFIFTPHSSAPVLKLMSMLAPSEGIISHCAFAACAPGKIRLYMMRNDSEIYSLEPEQQSEGQLEVLSHRNLPQSNFSALTAEQHSTAVRPEEPVSMDYLDSDGLGKTAVQQFMSSAPHMMPPLSLLSSAFLKHISPRNKTSDGETQIETKNEHTETDQSSDEDEVKTEQFETKKTELWAANYEAVNENRLKKIANFELSEELGSLLFSKKKLSK